MPVIWIPTIYIRLHSSTLCLWLNLCLRRSLSFLGYWLSCNFTHVPEIFENILYKRFHGIVSDIGVVETTRRPKIACHAWLLIHDQLRVYTIRILVCSQASTVDKIYSGHSTNEFIFNPRENLRRASTMLADRDEWIWSDSRCYFTWIYMP